MAVKKLIFKSCPMCRKDWVSRNAFMDDPELNFNGYQANFGTIEHGLFYFTHENEICGSTMAVKAELFLSLFNGEKYRENKQFSEECSRKCLDINELSRCTAHCEFAFVREVSQIIKDRLHKTTAVK